MGEGWARALMGSFVLLINLEMETFIIQPSLFSMDISFAETLSDVLESLCRTIDGDKKMFTEVANIVGNALGENGFDDTEVTREIRGFCRYFFDHFMEHLYAERDMAREEHPAALVAKEWMICDPLSQKGLQELLEKIGVFLNIPEFEGLFKKSFCPVPHILIPITEEGIFLSADRG